MKAWLLAFLLSAGLPGQTPNVRIPDESAGVDGIARTLISAFDHVDIVALGARPTTGRRIPTSE